MDTVLHFFAVDSYDTRFMVSIGYAVANNGTPWRAGTGKRVQRIHGKMYRSELSCNNDAEHGGHVGGDGDDRTGSCV
jgi:hypothetical protein